MCIRDRLITVPLDFLDLMKTAWNLLKREDRTMKLPPREEIDIQERMDFIRRKVDKKSRLTFMELFEKEKIGGFMFVGTFFALLELMKQRFISVRQKNPFGNIWIYRIRTKKALGRT